MNNTDPFQHDSALIIARAELAFNDPIDAEALHTEDQLACMEANWQMQDRERNQ